VTPTKPRRSRRLPSRPLRGPRHPHPLLPRPPPRRSRSRQLPTTTSPRRPRPCLARSPPARAPRRPSPRPPLLRHRSRRLRHRLPRPSSSLRHRPLPHRHRPRLRPRRLHPLPAPSRVAARVRARARLRSSSNLSSSSRRLRPRRLVRSPRPWCRRARSLPSLQASVRRVRATTRSAWVAATLPRRVLDLVPARVRSRAATTAPPAGSPVTRVRPDLVRQLLRAAAVPAPARVVLVLLPVRAVLAPTRATCLRARTPA
jgi:hypothetical protein